MKKLATTAAALGTAAVLVLGYDAVTYAGTGKSLILGSVNQSSKTTTIARTATGPALTLKTKSGPPLAVSSKQKVAKLNADTVDGKSASQLGTLVRVYALPSSGGSVTSYQAAVTDVPAGPYLVTYNVSGDASGTGVECVLQLERPGSSILTRGKASGTKGSDGDVGVGATVPIEVAAGDTVRLTCGRITGTFAVNPTDNVSSWMTFTPIDNVVAGSTS